MECYIGIDLGTSGVKAVVMEQNGTILGSGYVENPELIVNHPLWAEQMPDTWWKAVKKAVREAVIESGAADRIVSLAVAGQMLGNVMLDKDKKPIGNCMIWLDQRAVEELEEFKAIVGKERLMGLTKNIALTSLWAPKLMWIRRHRPDIYDKTRYVLYPKDYINYLLTGNLSIEVTDASGSALMDVEKRVWSKELFDLCGIPFDWVPPILNESTDCIGELTREAAKDLGLRPGIKVAAGAGDQSACGIGSGAVMEGVVSATIGTSGVVFAATNQVIPDTEEAAAMGYCHAVTDRWCKFGCTLGAGGSFKWARDTFFTEKEDCRAKGSNAYDRMTEYAAKSPVGSDGLLFLPYMNGERTPHPDPFAKGVFFGLSYRHDKNAIFRAIMEGVTMSLRDTLELLRKAGIEIKLVHASGGGARSPLWRQMQADIFNTQLVVNNVEETGCVGAAIIAGLCVGGYQNVQKACEQILTPVSIVEPNQEQVQRYEAFYQVYRGLYDSLKQDFQKLDEAMKLLVGKD